MFSQVSPFVHLIGRTRFSTFLFTIGVESAPTLMCNQECNGTKPGLSEDSLGKLLFLPSNNSYVCVGLQEDIHKYSEHRPTHS